MLLALAALAVFAISACGGGGSSQSTPPPPVYVAFTVAAASGSQTAHIALTLIINH
jgi:hypothetical protein